MDEVAYYIRGLLRQPNAYLARTYLGITDGGGGAVISAGGQSQNTGTIIFSNANNVTFGLTDGTLTASFAAGAGGSINFSAGTTSNNLASVTFADSNGISFGLNAGVITASHNALTSQSNQAFSAQGGASTFQTLSFNNANGITFLNNAGAIEASYSVPSTAGLISNINVSAGTTSNNLSAITFADGNGISFGLNAGTLTASHNGLTSQSNQAASASNGSFTFQTLNFSNANNVSFGTSAGGIIFASVAAPGGGGSINVSAGTTSNDLTQLVFSNLNNVTFGMVGSTITATAQIPALSAGTTSGTFQTYRFLDSNGISFGMSGSEITASHNGLTSQSNQAVSAANGSFTFQTLSLANSNGISFSTGTQGIFASHNALTSQSNQTIGLYAVSNTTQSTFVTADARSLSFAGAGVASVGATGGSIVISVPAGGGAGVTVSHYEPPWAFSGQLNTGLGANTLYFQPFDVPQNVYASRINFYFSYNGSISAGNSTGTCHLGMGYALYTKEFTGAASQTLSLLTSYSATIISLSHSSNTQLAGTHYIGLSNVTSHSTSQFGLSTSNATTYLATSLNGLRVVALPVNLTLTPGRYWLAFAISTVTGNAMTNQYSVYVATSATFHDMRPFGVASGATNASIFRRLQGAGFYSATSAAFPNSIAFTTDAIRAGTAITLVHFDLRGYSTSTNML